MGALVQADYDSFLKLGITRDIVDRARVRRVSRDEATNLLGIATDSGGIHFPFFLPPLNGNQTTRPVYHRVRQDRPPRDASGKEERKYLTSPGKTYPYFAPACKEWFDDKSVPVIISESPKAALSILRWAEDSSRRQIPVAVNGCWGWTGKVGIAPNHDGQREQVNDILDLLAEVCRGRRVYILFDVNERTNIKVKIARDNLAQRLLQGITNDVRLLHLPPAVRDPFWNGPDDFLGACGDAAFADLFEECEIVAPGAVESVLEEDDANVAEVEDMPDECMSGRLGDIYEKYLPRFPRAYGYTALVANASALIQDRALGVRTNFFGINVGASGSGKTEVDAWARSILGVCQSVLITGFIGSGEQFVTKYGDAEGNTRLFDPDEAAHFLSKAMLEHASFPYLFTRAFGQDQFEMTVGKQKKDEQYLFHQHLSFYGGIVEEKFEEAFTGASTAGFYQRCFFGHGPTNFPYNYQPVPTELRAREHCVPSAVQIDESVWEQLKEWSKELATERNDNRRLLEVCLRVMTICAAFDGRDVLTAKELGPMRHLIDYQKRVRMVLRPNQGETIEGKITDRILRFMESLPPGCAVTKRKLYTATHIHRLSTTTADRVLKSLIAQNLLRENRGRRADSVYISMPGVSV